MKLLRETYKTYEGALRRCAFENGIAKSEYERGYKAKLYHYTVVSNPPIPYPGTVDDTETFRVARHSPVKA